MKTTILKAARFYFVVTLVMCLNIATAYGLLYFYLSSRSKDGSMGSDFNEMQSMSPAHGDRAIIEQNLDKLNVLSQRGLHVDLRALLQLCGEPDGYVGDMNSHLTLLYYYNRFKTKDWEAEVWLDHGIMTGVGYNDSSVNDHTAFKKWDISSKDIPIYK